MIKSPYGMWRAGIALLLALCLTIGMCPNTALAAEKQNDEQMMLAWDWLWDYTKDNNPEIYDVCLQLANHIGSEKFAELCLRLETLYHEFDVATTAEQRAKLVKAAYSLTLRLQKIAAMATASKVDNIDYYVSIGDSTLSGYGLDKYIPGMNNGEDQVLGDEASVLLAKKLFNEDYEAHFKKLDHGGIRVEDLLVFLGENEFMDDYYLNYTMENTEYATEEKQNLYINEVKKADLITLALGGNNITNFLGRQIDRLKEGNTPYEMDWDRYFPQMDMEKVHAHIDTLARMMEGQLPDIFGIPAEQIAPVLAESFLYGLVTYLQNYPKVMETIREINPDAHLVLIGYFNSIDTLVIPVTIEGLTIAIPAGAMLGTLIESCNATALAHAMEYPDKTTFVSIADTTTILDEQGIFDMESQMKGVLTETWLTHPGPAGHQYIADQIYTAITTEYTEQEILLAVIQATLEELGVMDVVNEGIQAAQDKLNGLMHRIENATPAELLEALLQLDAQVAVALEDLTMQLEVLETELAEKKAQLENLSGAQKDVLIAAIGALEEKIRETKLTIAALQTAMTELKQTVENLENVTEILLNEGVYAAIAFVQTTVGEMGDGLENLVAVVSNHGSEKLNEAIENVKAQLDSLYYEALQAVCTVAEDFHYVALGDSTVVSESYADMVSAGVAEELAGILAVPYSFTNLAQDGLMIQDTMEILAENAEEIAKADLVTIGFGSTGFTNFMVENLMKQIKGEPVEFDWSQFLGKEDMHYVEEVKAELYNSLMANGISGNLMGVNLTDLLELAIESYAYGAVAYACSLPETVDAIHEQNPEAQVVVVGMYNPLANVVIKLGESELEIGKYMQYLVEAANAEALGYAMMTENAVFVDAPLVETDNRNTQMTILQFVMEFMYNKAVSLNPNEAGHSYIAEQILNAIILTEYVEEKPEDDAPEEELPEDGEEDEEKILLGDVNGDGLVNHNDARLVLQYYVGMTDLNTVERSAADVNGDGQINHNDARLILQFYVGIIINFPVEV